MEADGWYCIKLIKTNRNGIPDVCCVKPNDVIFIEVKKPGGKTSKLQDYRIKELNDKGIKAIVKWGVE
jgi:Holliday junction resolvase